MCYNKILFFLFCSTMGTELLGPCLKDDPESIPPGFSPHPAFTLQRIKENDMATDQTSDPLRTSMVSECSSAGDEKLKKSLRHRPSVNYKCFDNSSDEDEPETAVVKQVSTDFMIFYCLIM